ncbi:MAG: TonB-dependent receptor [Myxococcota bacterium]
MGPWIATWTTALALSFAPTRSDPHKSDPHKSDVSQPDAAQPDASQPDASQPDPNEPDELTPPRLTTPVTATPPEIAADAPVEVLLSLEIDTQGRVTHVEVIESGGPAFDDAATEAARQFVFEPAREGGAPIPVQIQYRYVFDPTTSEAQTEPPAPESDRADSVIDDTEQVIAARIEPEAAQTELTAEQGERIAGTQGDALKAAQTLAGVARPAAGSTALAIWGALPTESRLYIDGIPVPRLLHLGGSRSVLPTPRLESVTLVPGGFGAPYGRAIGGMMEARTRPPRPTGDPHRVGGFVQIDPIDVGGAVDARLTDRSGLTLSVRRSILAQTYGAISEALAPTSSQGLVPLPDYWDYQAQATVELSDRDTLTLHGFGAHDRIERGIPSLTPDAAFSEQRTAGFHRAGIRLLRLHPDGRSLLISAWGGLDDDRWAQDFSQVRASSQQRAGRGGLRLQERRRLARIVVLRWGLDIEIDRTVTERDGAITLPAREGDIVVFGQPPGDRVGRDRWTTVRAGMGTYAALRVSPAEGRWIIEPGLRVEPILVSGDRTLPVRPIEPEIGTIDAHLALDPRLHVRWAPLPSLALFTAGGRYHQAPQPEDRSPVFGNPQLVPAQAYHVVAGTEITPADWLDLAVTGFWIRATDLTGRSADPTPPVATLLVAEGQGRSYGGQLTAQIHPHPSVFAGLAYTLTRAQRRDPGVATWRLSDFDQPHRLQALVGWSHRSGVELGGRMALASGYPRTGVVDAAANARTGGYDPIFGEHNAERLPLTWWLSVRLAWRRAFEWGELYTWLDVYNPTNRRNPEEVFYTSDFSRRGTVDGLPILPTIGIQVRR